MNHSLSWRKDYLLSLREVRNANRTGSSPAIKVGNIVILKDESIKRLFWKLTKVVQLLEGSDGIPRAALINVTNEVGPPRILKRSTCHLIPVVMMNLKFLLWLNWFLMTVMIRMMRMIVRLLAQPTIYDHIDKQPSYTRTWTEYWYCLLPFATKWGECVGTWLLAVIV